eukprot:170109-Pleurochrysis_carterae.AAC.5
MKGEESRGSLMTPIRAKSTGGNAIVCWGATAGGNRVHRHSFEGLQQTYAMATARAVLRERNGKRYKHGLAAMFVCSSKQPQWRNRGGGGWRERGSSPCACVARLRARCVWRHGRCGACKPAAAFSSALTALGARAKRTKAVLSADWIRLPRMAPKRTYRRFALRLRLQSA